MHKIRFAQVTEKTHSSWPSYTVEEAEAVTRVLLSNRVNYWNGDEGRSFEREFANWCECDYAIAMANGTLALEAALAALGIGAGDEVIVTARTFIASASAIVVRGARAVFADVDAVSQTLSIDFVRSLITPRTRAIICVHLAGWPCEMDELVAIAEEHSLYLIEDCAQAHGARYKGRPVGSLGHIAAWSFCQDKIMTTGGEGGMVTTNDRELWSRVWSYKDHGKSWQAVYEEEHPAGYRWVHGSFGSNWRMTEMQAAIGRIQLERMENWHRMRTLHAARIAECCRKFPQSLRVTEVPSHIEHAWYKFFVFVKPSGLADGWGRERIMMEINERGVPCYTGGCPEVYLEAAFEGTDMRPARRLPVARELGEQSLMFLVHPTLTELEISETCNAITLVMQQAQR